MTDVQRQRSAEELPNMHASANWVSRQGTTGLLTALIEYLTVLLEYFNLSQSRWQGTTVIWQGLCPAWPTLGYVATAHVPPRSIAKFIATKAIGQKLTQINNSSLL